MTQKRRSNWMRQADTAFSQYIRTRDGACQADPPHAGNLQCAHIISRSYKQVRTVPENAVALCAKHHVYFTHRPLEWMDWVEDRFPGRWDELSAAARSEGRVDWKAEADYWRHQT